MNNCRVNRNKCIYTLFLSASVFLIACNSDKNNVICVPAHLAATVPQPAYNSATKAGIALGQRLFFDTLLSGNNTISCASCHIPKYAFSDSGKIFSTGTGGQLQRRNTPALFNLAWANGYFWDGGAKNLESQVFAPLQAHNEMDQDLKALVAELETIPSYKSAFKEAFGTDSITSAAIARAIAQFERSLIAANSKFDAFINDEKGAILSENELKGFEIFKKACVSCHKVGFFTDFGYHNNGLDSSFTDDRFENLYKGRYRITLGANDIGKYKTPSLRNLAYTAPYMHDGRFASLEEVIEHYSHGLRPSATLDTVFRKKPAGFGFSEEEKKVLIIFLATLNSPKYPVE